MRQVFCWTIVLVGPIAVFEIVARVDPAGASHADALYFALYVRDDHLVFAFFFSQSFDLEL